MVNSESQKQSHRVLDCIGLYCPAPILHTRQEIDKLDVGELLEVLADDPAAEEDIKAWAKHAGQKLLSIDRTADGMKFLIRKEK